MEDRAKALAVARILTGASTAQREALRLKVHLRTVERWVAERRAAAAVAPKPTAPPSPAPPDASPDAAPPENAGPAGPAAENTELKRVLEAAGGPQAAAAASPPAQKPAAAGWGGGAAEKPADAKEDGRRRDAEEALKYLASIKAAAVGLGGMMVGVPLTDERLEEASELSFFAEMAVEENAEDVGAIVREKLRAGPWVVVAILLLDLLASLWMTWKLAKEHAAKRPPVKLPPKDEKKPAERKEK